MYVCVLMYVCMWIINLNQQLYKKKRSTYNLNKLIKETQQLLIL